MKPRGPLELIDAGFQLYRNHFSLFATIAAVTVLPQTVLSLIIFRVGGGTWGVDVEAMKSSGKSVGGLLLLYAVVASVSYMVLQASLVCGASEVYHGRNPKPMEVIRKAVPFMMTAAVASSLCGIGMFFGFLCFLVPGMFLSVYWAFTAQIVMIEKTGARAALKRSGELTRGLRGFIGTYLLLVTLLVWLIAFGCNAAFAASLKSMPLVMSLLQALPQVVLTPLYSIVMTLGYFDARIRKEAYDLEAASGSLNG